MFVLLINISNAVIHKCYRTADCTGGSLDKYGTEEECCLNCEQGYSYSTADGCKICTGSVVSLCIILAMWFIVILFQCMALRGSIMKLEKERPLQSHLSVI